MKHRFQCNAYACNTIFSLSSFSYSQLANQLETQEARTICGKIKWPSSLFHFTENWEATFFFFEQAHCHSFETRTGLAGQPGPGTGPGLSKNPLGSWLSETRLTRNPAETRSLFFFLYIYRNVKRRHFGLLKGQNDEDEE